MENDFSGWQFVLSILHFQFILRVPADAEVNCQAGDDEADQTNGKRPGVGAGGVEEIAANPGAEGAAQAEANFQKPEDQTDLVAGNISPMTEPYVGLPALWPTP